MTRLCVLIFFIALGSVSASVYSQNTKLTLNMHNSRLVDVFNSIEEQTNFYFFYNRDLLDDQQIVTVDVENKNIDEILDKLFYGKNISYTIDDRSILIGVNNSNKSILNQQINIEGKVTDSSGAPMPGVTVVVKGTKKGAITDGDGSFTLPDVSEDAILLFSFVGMKMQEVAVSGKSIINVTMVENTIGIDEVVAIGYGTQKRVNLTGAVGSVDGENLANKAVGNVTSALAGLVPGLKVMNRGGKPGNDGAALSIRGFGAPLILVDGIEQSFAYMDPAEIENISILKDASAAVYGARAANGVILVTTKRGKKGAPKFNMHFNTGFSAPTRTIEMANSGLYAELTNEANLVDGNQPTFTDEEIAKYYDGTDPLYPNTDWRKETLKSFSPKYDINMNLRGGGERVSYFLSLGYLNQKSLLRSDDINFDRVSFRSNVDAQINSVLSLSADFSGRLEYRENPGRGMPVIMTAIQAAKPTVPAHYPDYSKPTYPGYNENDANPLPISERDYSGYEDHDFSSVRGTFSANLNFDKWIKGLSADGKFDYRLNNNLTKEFKTTFNYYDYNYDTEEYVVTGRFNGGHNSLRESYAKDWLWYSLFKLNYDRIFAGKHHVTGLALVEAQSNRHDDFFAYREGFISTRIDEMFAGADENKNNGGGASEGGRMSYVFKLGYNYGSRYLIDFVSRVDGSAKFNKSNRWGFFPGVSAAWRISEETFFKNRFKNVDNLKLRVSVGQAGDEANVNFNYLTGYVFGNNYIFDTSETVLKGLKTKGLANRDARWAETTTYNIGTDYSIYNRKFYTEVDVFYRLKSKMLATRIHSLPSTFGAALPQENINKQDTRGFELMLGHANKIGDFIYDIKANVSWARSKWIHFEENERTDPQQQYRYDLTGKWTNIAWGYEADGLFSSQEEIDGWADITNGANNNVIRPGDVRYVDQNDDGIINWEDEVQIGKDTDPEIFFGLSGDFNYKSWSLNVLFQGATNYSEFNSDQFVYPFGINLVPYAFWEDRWTDENPDAKLPRVRYATGHPNGYTSSFWVLKNAYYMRLKNIQLSYSFHNSWTKKVGIDNLKLFVTGNNVLTITNVEHKDPESDSSSGFYYPQVKTFTAGINLNF
ncbi:TonB-dependent receptor [Sunxiuqinia sp. A32]|uniref:TonB-dependent receptor n=1 Tax=Sunxiuqinia sp. A32 TaxID=3461496 RepID=UPI0040453F9B